MNIQAIESQVHQRLDAMRADIIQLTQEMVAFKSVNPRFMADPDSSDETGVQDYLEARLKRARPAIEALGSGAAPS